MSDLRFAVLGCGFWSQFQIAAWKERGGVRCVAVWNRTRSKADAVAERFDISKVYDDAEELLAKEQLDFVDIITAVEAHAPLAELAAASGVDAICQKPMSTNLATAQRMVIAARDAGTRLLIHENWRWQRPIRELKRVLTDGGLGRCFRARVTFSSSFPVFDNQPFLKELDQFILTDIGSHILDAARFLFGDARSVYCRTRRVNPTIRGEDVATAVMAMGDDTTVTCEMSYATEWEHELFPETFIFAECEGGSVGLGPDCSIRITRDGRTEGASYPPPTHDWADPAYGLVHDSIVGCNGNLLRALRTGEPAETEAADNIKTVRLVFACYESADRDAVIRLDG